MTDFYVSYNHLTRNSKDANVFILKCSKYKIKAGELCELAEREMCSAVLGGG